MICSYNLTIHYPVAQEITIASFRSPKEQAKWVMQQLQGKRNHIKSVGTVRDYEQQLTQCAKWLQEGHCPGITHIKDLDIEHSLLYLDYRSCEVSQKTLDMDRQALQRMHQHITHQLEPKQRLPVIKSLKITELLGRSYTPEQVHAICEHQHPHNALATELAYHAGLRAHELLTIARPEEQPAHDRPALPNKFHELEGEIYTVQGKGGLIREVVIPYHLAQQLEHYRLAEPKITEDRQIYYEQHYDITGGQAWSSSVTKACQRIFDWSHGAHGLRHSYAQLRMEQLISHYDYVTCLATVSQEMGHFRADITLVYLR